METELTRPQPTPTRPRSTRTPLVDIYENDTDVLLVADVPGSRPESVKVEVESGILRFTAEGAGSAWARAFVLPRGIAVDGVRAELVAGVLRITLPKSSETRRRTVEVKAG